MPVNCSGNSFIKSLVDLMDLAAVGTVMGLTFVGMVEAGAGLWGFVQGCMTVTTQFIFMIATNMNWSWEFECQGQLAARHWGHGVQHIGLCGIHYRWWAWCWCDPGQWAGWLGWSSLGWDIKTHGGQHITSISGVNLDMEWGCSFIADAYRQYYHGVCFIAPWGTDVVYHYLFRRGVPCSSTVDCIRKQLITWGCFLSADLYYVGSLPLFPVSVMGGLPCFIGLSGMFAYSSRAMALCMPVVSFGTAIADGVLCGTVVMARGVWAGTVWALWVTLLWLALLRLTALAKGMDGLACPHCSHSRFNSRICLTYLQ